MKDLVDRLRNRPHRNFDADPALVPYDTLKVDALLDEAAAEIERLQAIVAAKTDRSVPETAQA